jgi:transposase
MELGKKSRRARRHFTEEFRAGAVRLVLDEGQTIGRVARDLDLTVSALRAWVARARADRSRGRSGGLTTVEREELARLRKENRELRMERDILKNFRARRGPSHLLDEKLGAQLRDGRPGVVAVCLMVASGARKKTWSGGGLRT